ncbi:MAG: RCC1 repeat-containing protein, partial [Spirochaetales bacterium]
LSGVASIAAGDSHTVALKSDGTVWTWGDNSYGQLGDGTTTERTTPVLDSVLSGVVAIAAGGCHTVALKSDGTVWTWGSNDYGQLGDGTTTDSPTPVPVSSLSGVTAIAAGYQHTVALKSDDGTVWTWGWNDYGQLGDDTTTDSPTPVPVSSLSGVAAIAAGGVHTVAQWSGGGTVWTWGSNDYGQLGDGTIIDRYTPVPLTSLSGVASFAAGLCHTVALKSNDGTVWTWGNNSYGQLGDGTIIERHTPVKVFSLSEVASIAAGGVHTVALKSNGTVWTWGCNEFGQLGDDTTTERHIPVLSGGPLMLW